MNKYFVSEIHPEEAFTAGVVNRHMEHWLKLRDYKSLNYRWKKEGSAFIKILRLVQVLYWYIILPRNSIVLFHVPIIPRASFFFLQLLKRKKIFTIALVHDIEGLRFGNEDELKKEQKTLQYFQHVILHNTAMQKFVKPFYPIEKTSLLWLFDYYCSTSYMPERSLANEWTLAANLEKATYVKNNLQTWLATHPTLILNVYGALADRKVLDLFPTNFHYQGKVNPDDLPAVLKGSFGVIWDGDNLQTCNGTLGNYLRYNTPHKLSLYLAAGLPVIVWNESAMAAWVKTNEVGITVSSWDDAVNQVKLMQSTTYLKMHQNACTLGKKVRDGYYLNTVLEKVESIANNINHPA
jgi:hypothetical protein